MIAAEQIGCFIDAHDSDDATNAQSWRDVVRSFVSCSFMRPRLQPHLARSNFYHAEMPSNLLNENACKSVAMAPQNES